MNTIDPRINAATMPLNWRHYRIVAVASLGQVIGTAVATVAGIIIPLLNIITHPELSSFMQGVIGASDLIGISIGSVIFGRLIDKYGYLLFFRLCPALMLVAAVIAALVPHVAVLTVALFIVGLGIGGEYSLDSGYTSVLVPQKYKGLMVGITKGASAFGNIAAAGIAMLLIDSWGKPEIWPKLMWIIAGMSALMVVVRIRFYESPGWLLSKGKTQEAEKCVEEFLGKNVYIEPDTSDSSNTSDTSNTSNTSNSSDTSSAGMASFFKENVRRVILSGIPWACEGLGVYGIGVFLPILVMALGLEHFTPGEPAIEHVAYSVEITLYISCIILPGFIMGLILIHKGVRLTKIQTWGFALCAVALGVLIPAYMDHWNKWVAIGAFMAFEFCLNMGPHLITYVLPSKIYPIATRGLGVGIASAIGKIGAVLGVFLIPVLLQWGGAELVLIVSAAVMAIGAIVTFAYRKVGRKNA